MSTSAKNRTIPAAFQFGHPEELLLRAVARYHYLTPKQAVRAVRYSPTSLGFVQHKLKLLAEAGLLLRRSPGHAGRTGSAEYVYAVADNGARVLRRELGLTVQALEPAEYTQLSPYFLRHNLAVTDFLITADLLPTIMPGSGIAAMKHDRELKRHPVRVVLPDGVRASVILDGWVDIRLGTFQECLALELDRGTEEQKVWNSKIARLLAFAAGPYQQAFGTQALTILIVATPGEGRVRQLLKWTESELTRQRATDEDSELFWFTACDPAAGPEALFFSPVWYRPFLKEPLVLWERPGA